MNKIYKLIWSQTANAFVVVSELASARGKSSSTTNNAALGAWVAVSEITKSKGKKSNKAIKSGVLVSSLVLFAGNAIAASYDAGGGNATGPDSVAIGNGAASQGLNSTAIGIGATAVDDDATALGYRAEAIGKYSTAVGDQAKAKQEFSNALGYNATADAIRSTAIGMNSSTSGVDSVSIGNSSSVSGNWSAALGQQASVQGDWATAIGYKANAQSTGSTAIGTWAKTYGTDAVALGNGAEASGFESLALGKGAKTDSMAAQALAVGNRASAVGIGSNAIGWNAKATAQNATAIGSDAHANSIGSLAIGMYSKTSGMDSAALGNSADASAFESLALGHSAKTSGSQAAALGNSAEASGSESLALGHSAKSSGLDSAALGHEAVASGSESLALGKRAKTDSIADHALAVGFEASAEGLTSNAIGWTANATARNATAIGSGAKAYSRGGIAMGSSAEAGSKGSEETLIQAMALGTNSKAKAQSQDVALGADSETSTVANTQNTQIDGKTYTYAGTNAKSTLSVGKSGAERTITNVAAGRISGTSTDAINGSQLYGTNQAINSLAGDVDTLGNATAAAIGGNSTYNPSNHTVSAPTYNINNQNVSTVSDAINKLNEGWNLTSNGSNTAAVRTNDTVDIGTATGETNLIVAKNGNTIDYSLNKKLDLGATGSVNAGGTVINNNGLSFVDSNGATLANTPSIKKDGINAGGQQIANVAAGTGDTDAVNVAQLKAATTHYYSVNDGGTQGSNYNNDGATGGNSLAAGVGTQASGISSTAIGHNAKASSANAIAMGVNASASQRNATAIGSDAHANSIGSLAIGMYSKTSGMDSAALGNSADASGFESLALGHSAKTSGSQAAALGNSAEASGSESLALGHSAKSSGLDSAALGHEAVASGSESLALGKRAKTDSIADHALAVGFEASAEGLTSNAIGWTANATARNATAIGSGAKAYSRGGIAMGSSAEAGSKGSEETLIQAMALGTNSKAKAQSQDVALGADSETSTVANTQNTQIDGKTYTYAGTNAKSTLSVGKSGAERTITNVAAGRISGTSTDAINGSQLYGTNQAINSLAGDVDTLGNTTAAAIGGNSTYNPSNHTVSAPTYNINNQNVSTVSGAINKLNEGWNLTSNGNSTAAVRTNDTVDIGTATGETNLIVAKNGNTIDYSLNKNLDLGATGSVNAGGTVINNNGLSFVDSNGATLANTPSIKKDGINAGGQQIANVAAGTGDTDAVNVSQLKAAQAAATTKVEGDKGVSVTPTTNADGSKTYTVAAKTDNTTVKVDDKGNIAAVTAPLTYTDGKVNTPAAPNALATAGDIANAINNSGWKLAADGTSGTELINPSDTVTFKTGSSNLTVKRDGANITYDLARNINVDSVQIGANGPKITNDGNNIKIGDKDGNATKITNVAAGTGNTDAVNVSQLKAAANNLVTTGFNIADGKGGNDNVKLGETVTFTDPAGNIITTVTDNKVEFGLNRTLSVGKAGEPGKVGIKGADGKDAISLNGEDGTIGINGKDGTNATLTVEKGKPGLDGKDGQTRIVYTKPDGSKEEVATLNDGLNFKADDGSIVPKKLNETLEIVGGADKDSLTDNNIGVNNKNGKLTVQLAKDININSVKFGNNGPTIKADASNNINIAKSDGSPTKITNVEAGTGDNDAVNVSQLKAAANNLVTTGFNIADGKGGNDNVKLGETVTFTDPAGNIITTVTDNKVEFGLNRTLSVGKAGEPGKVGIKGADGKDAISLNGEDGTIGINGKDGTNATLTVEKGKPGLDGKDGQTRIVYTKPDGSKEEVATLNDGLNFKADDGSIVPKKLNETLEIVGGADKDSLTDNNIGVNNKNGKLTVQLAKDININSVKFGNNGPTIKADASNNINIAKSDGSPTKITNVEAGTGDNDAVNVSQLKAAQAAATTKVAGDKGVSVTPTTNADGSKTYTVAAKTDNTTVKVDDKGNIAAVTAPLTTNTDGKVNTPAAPNALATAGDIANAINNSGWKLAADGTSGTELINPSDTVTFKTGSSNLTVKRDGANITYDLAKDININSVKFGNNGPTIKADASNNINIAKSDGSPTKITNVEAGTGDNDAVNVSQLKAAQAAATTKVEGDKGVSVTPTTNADGSKTYTVAAKTDNTTVKVDDKGNIAAVTAPLTTNTDGKVNTPAAPNALATAGDIANAINNSGWKLAADGTTGTELINPSDTVTFKTGSSNLTVKRDGANITYDLAKDININSVKFGDNGPTIKADASNNINIAKSDGSATKITNVEAGTGDKDAVNVSQLKAVEATANKGWNLTTNGKADSKSNVKPGDTVDFANTDGNVKIENTGNKVTVNLNKDIDLTKDGSVTIGDTKVNKDGLTIAGGPSVTKSGIDAGDKKITNVAPGKISADSKDAINGSQLYTVQQAAVAAKTEVKAGDNVEVKKGSGDNGQDIYTVSAKDTSASVTAGSTAVAVTKGATTKVGTTDVTDYKVDLSQSAKDDIKKGVDAKDIVDNKGLTFAGDSGSTSVQKLGSTVNVKGDKNITTKASGNTVEVALNPNVTVDSVTATQAVNVGAGNAQVALTTNVGRDGVNELNVAGNNGAPTRITNVAPGVKGTDAVNIDQLKGVAYNISNRIDDVADDANAGVSSAMAMAALPQAYIPGKSMLTGGIASYNGEGAVAVGFSKLSDNGRWVLKVSGSADTQGNAGGAVGAGFHF